MLLHKDRSWRVQNVAVLSKQPWPFWRTSIWQRWHGYNIFWSLQATLSNVSNSTRCMSFSAVGQWQDDEWPLVWDSVMFYNGLVIYSRRALALDALGVFLFLNCSVRSSVGTPMWGWMVWIYEWSWFLSRQAGTGTSFRSPEIPGIQEASQAAMFTAEVHSGKTLPERQNKLLKHSSTTCLRLSLIHIWRCRRS